MRHHVETRLVLFFYSVSLSHILTEQTFELPMYIILDIIGIISVACFAWAWRLQIQVTRLRTIQEIKTDRLDKIERSIENLCNKVNHMSGMLEEHLKK